MTLLKNALITVFALSIGLSGCGSKMKKAPAPNEPSVTGYGDIIPLTEGNIKGHKLLYNEGWFVVSSTKRAFEYAHKKSFKPSRENIRRIARDLVNRSKDFGEDVGKDTKDSYANAKALLEGGTLTSTVIASGTGELAGIEFDYAKQTFTDACDAFVKGHLSLARRTPEDLGDLKSVPGNYFSDLRDDFSNIFELSSHANQTVAKKIGLSWDKSFEEAAADFRAEYEQSGKRKNSLTALGDILSGYLKALYSGLARPSAKAIVEGGAKGANTAIFLPGAIATVISGRTIEATGLTLYYTAKTGYHVISPTLETGLLSSLSLLSIAAVPVTAAGGASLCAVNQVAFTAAAPVYGAGKAVTDTAVDTGKYVALVSYDLTTHSSGILINHMKTGVVLGYNALTAIPVHLIMLPGDAAVFLAYDGPRLVIAAARGELKKNSGESAFSLGGLPTGAVVDLDKLGQEKGVTVEILTDDPSTIKDVIENLQKDLGETHE